MSLTKDPTICSCECREGDETTEGGAQTPSSARGIAFCRDTCERCADMIREDSCERRYWGL
eukprot:9502279-Pyramimonas_sp.AAC.1